MNATQTFDSGAGPAARRHDFDALRAAAMLLGIALHAGLAYAPIPWLAMNRETSPAIGAFIEVLHGFRLPLFFVMSGFFSAMLLQRRGVAGFLGHRWRRIALPLLLGVVTIIPAMWGVIIGGHAIQQRIPPPAREAAPAPPDDGDTIWRAAANGDVETVTRLALDGVPVDRPDGKFSTLPLAWAATGDHAAVVAFLLDHGADPNQRMGDDNTPMHTACFFGASESAALMLRAGGNPNRPNAHGETPIDAMRHGAGIVSFIADLLGVEADFERVEAGRSAIAAMLETESQPTGSGSRALGRVVGLLRGEVFLHLWFLWHLCWLAAGLVAARLLLRPLPRNLLPDALVSTPLCLLWLIPLTALTQSRQANFGPDTSAALIPAPHVLLHYAVFFGFGSLMHDSRAAANRLGRAWWAYLAVAAASCVVALKLVHDATFLAEHGLDGSSRAWLAAAMQAAFVWTASLGLIGLARRVLARPNPRVRYVSDASYWMYVAHLPLVVAGQFALAYVPLHPLLEFAGLTAATTAALLLSYQWCVRYTWIGRLLNGRRDRPPRERSGPRRDGPRSQGPGVAALRNAAG